MTFPSISSTPQQIADQVAANHDMSGPESEQDWRAAIVAAIEMDRSARTQRSSEIVSAVIYANYGPEGSEETFREAEALTMFAPGERDVDAETLLSAALSIGHLDADGILAMMREAAR